MARIRTRIHRRGPAFTSRCLQNPPQYKNSNKLFTVIALQFHENFTGKQIIGVEKCPIDLNTQKIRANNFLSIYVDAKLREKLQRSWHHIARNSRPSRIYDIGVLSMLSALFTFMEIVYASFTAEKYGRLQAQVQHNYNFLYIMKFFHVIFYQKDLFRTQKVLV